MYLEYSYTYKDIKGNIKTAKILPIKGKLLEISNILVAENNCLLERKLDKELIKSVVLYGDDTISNYIEVPIQKEEDL